MTLLRALGLYVSLFIMGTVHVLRFWYNAFKKHNDIQGVRVIVIRDRHVLLVSHWYAPWVWTLPGGGVDVKESPTAAAIREVFEETGLRVNSIAGEIGTYQGSMGADDLVRVFYTGDVSGSILMRPNFEIMARSWFPIDRLPPQISPANKERIEAYRAGVREERGNW